MPLRHQLARCHVHQRALNSRAADIHPQYDRCCRRRACRRSWRLLSCRAGSTLAHKARQGGAAGGKARVGTQRPPRSQTGRLLAGGATEKTRGGGRRSSGLERGLEPPRGGDGDRHAGMHVVRARACVAGTSVRRAWRELLYCTVSMFAPPRARGVGMGAAEVRTFSSDMVKVRRSDWLQRHPGSKPSTCRCGNEAERFVGVPR